MPDNTTATHYCQSLLTKLGGQALGGISECPRTLSLGNSEVGHFRTFFFEGRGGSDDVKKLKCPFPLVQHHVNLITISSDFEGCEALWIKKNLRAIQGRCFETCSFQWYLRFGLKVLEFKVNSKILLFAEVKAGFLKLSKNTYMYRKKSYMTRNFA